MAKTVWNNVCARMEHIAILKLANVHVKSDLLVSSVTEVHVICFDIIVDTLHTVQLHVTSSQNADFTILDTTTMHQARLEMH